MSNLQQRWSWRYRTCYTKRQTARWSTAEQVRTIQKDSGRYKGGGAELHEEKNQLLQAILDCTSKNVYILLLQITTMTWRP